MVEFELFRDVPAHAAVVFDEGGFDVPEDVVDFFDGVFAGEDRLTAQTVL